MPGPAGDAHGIIENEGGEDNEEDEVQDEEEETRSDTIKSMFYIFFIVHFVKQTSYSSNFMINKF